MTFLALLRPLGHLLMTIPARGVKGLFCIDISPSLVAFAARLWRLFAFLEGVVAFLAFQTSVFLMGEFHFAILTLQNNRMLLGPHDTNHQKCRNHRNENG